MIPQLLALSPPGSDWITTSQAQAGRGNLGDGRTGGEQCPELPLPGEVTVVVHGVVSGLPAGAVSAVGAGLQVETPVLTVSDVDIGSDCPLQQVQGKLADRTHLTEGNGNKVTFITNYLPLQDWPAWKAYQSRVQTGEFSAHTCLSG